MSQLSELEKTFGTLRSGNANTNRRAATRLARNKGAIHELQKSINDNPRFGKMVEYSVECFKNMAVSQVCVEEMIEEGVLDTLIKVQKLNPYNENVHRIVNECIAAMCLNEEMARLVAEKIGSGNMVFGCKKHTSPDALASSCKAMHRMMRDIDGNVDMFVDNEIIEGLDLVAATHHSNPMVMAEVAECLRCISRCPKHIPALLNTKLLQHLLLALKANPKDAKLVASALAFLAAIAAVDGPHIAMLRDMGVVDLIVAALEANADNKAILALGAEALRRLAGRDDILHALKVNVAVTDETANALARLSSLMLVDENIDKMIDAQGIQWLISALQQACAAPPSEVANRIMISGSRAVERICADEKKIYAIMQAGGVPTMLQIISKHGHNEDVLVAALNAVAKMITRKENAELLLKCKIVAAVESSRKAHPKSPKVALACAEILERLSRHQSFLDQLVEQGVVYKVHDMLKQFKDDPEIVKVCLQALQNLSASPAAVKQMMELDIAKLMSELLKKYEDDPEIVGMCLDYLSAMVRNSPESIEYLKNSGVMKYVLSALNKQKENAALQALGNELMKLLAGTDQMKEAVAAVWSTSQHMIKNPAQAQQYSAKLAEATTILKNLAAVDSNYDKLAANNAQAALMSAIESALKLPISDPYRAQILADAAAGLESMTKHHKGPEAMPLAKQILKNGQLFQLLEAAIKDKDENLSEIAMSILAEVSKHSVLHDELIKAGAVSYAVQVSKLFPYNEIVQACAATTLANLASNAEAVAQIIKAGGAQTILDSILMNVGNKAELLKALEILRTIAQDPEINSALWDAGVLDAILAVWKKHQKDPEVVDSCLQALVVMLVSEEVALAMGEKGVCELAIPAIRTHFRQPVLIESDVVLLDSLASALPNAERLLTPEFATIDLMAWVARKFASRPTTVEAANRLAETLRDLEKRMEEERLANEVRLFQFDLKSCQQLFQNMEAAQENPDALKAMFQKLEMLMTSDDVVKMLALNGGLHSMSQLMIANKEKEDIFKPASNIFLRMCCKHSDEEVNAVLQHPNLLQAHAEIIRPRAKKVFQAPMPEDQQVQVATGLSKIRFTQEGLNALFTSGTLAQLTQFVKTNENPDALREAVRIIGKASANDELNPNIVPKMQHGLNGFATIRDLIDALRKHLNNYDFVRFGIYILGNLAVNDDVKMMIGLESGVLLVLQAVLAHHEETALIKNAFFTLATLTFDHPVNCAFVMASSGIPIVLRTMKANQQLPDLLDSCLCVLCNMCHGNDGNKSLIVSENGAEVIVDTVLNNFDQVDVLLSAFRILGILAFNATSVGAIVKVGGVQGIVAGMTVLGDNIEVVDVAVRVLTNLATNCSDEHMKIMSEEGAVQAIVDALTCNTTNVDIALQSVTALCNLSVMPYNADHIIKQNGVETTITALGSLGYDAEFVDMAIRLLFNLTYSINNLNRIIAAGLTPAVLNALKGMLTNTSVLSIGLRCISNLCYSDEVALKLAEDGPIEFSLALIHQHTGTRVKDSPAIINQALMCLSALSRSEDNSLAMASQSLQACIQLLTVFQTDAQIALAATTFLTNLFVHSAPSIAATETTLVPALNASLTTHIHDIEVLLMAVKPYENMAFASQSVRDYLKAQNCIEKLSEIKKENSDRQDVLDACNNTIYAINRVEQEHVPISFVDPIRKRRQAEQYDEMGQKIEDPEEIQVIELTAKTKNFLTAGAILSKHSNSAQPRPRHVYMTDDCKWIIWKDPKKPVEDDAKVKVFKIVSVDRGRCTDQLKRKTTFGKFLAEEKHCFSIKARDRTLDLECDSEKEREKWVNAIEQLLIWKKSKQDANQQGKFTDKYNQ